MGGNGVSGGFSSSSTETAARLCHRPYGPGLPEVGLLLIGLIRASGIDRALSTALALWGKPLAVRDSGKILLDLAIMLVLGGDCLADVNLLRCESGVFGGLPRMRRCRG
jgi:hypothetical protein